MNYDFQACGVYVFYRGNILLLKRATHKSHGGKWCVPSGGVEKDELPLDAALRELSEETGISLNKEDLVHNTSEVIVMPGGEGTCLFHQYIARINSSLQVILNHENSEFVWIDPRDALELDLIHEEDVLIKRCLDL